MDLSEAITTVVVAVMATLVGNKVKDNNKLRIDFNKSIEARLDILETKIGVGIYICTADGKCIYTNRYLAEIFECDKEEMQNFGWTKKVVEQQKVLEKWTYCFTHELSYFDKYDILVNTKLKTVETKAEPVFNSKGKLEVYIGVLNEKLT